MSDSNPNAERETERQNKKKTDNADPEDNVTGEGTEPEEFEPSPEPEPTTEPENATDGGTATEAQPQNTGKGERNVTNPETKSRLDEARLERQREEKQEEIEETQKAASARQKLADEEQPDPDAEKEEALQDLLETTTVEFRGREFDFAEFGDTIIEAQEFSDLDAEEGSKAANFVYEVLGKKCVSPEYADEEFWRNFDFGSEDGNGILNLFNRLVEETQDISEEERKEIEEFRNE